MAIYFCPPFWVLGVIIGVIIGVIRHLKHSKGIYVLYVICFIAVSVPLNGCLENNGFSIIMTEGWCQVGWPTGELTWIRAGKGKEGSKHDDSMVCLLIDPIYALRSRLPTKQNDKSVISQYCSTVKFVTVMLMKNWCLYTHNSQVYH